MATAQATKAQRGAAASNAPAVAPVVRVIGQGTLLEGGSPFLLVTSGSELGRFHVVVYRYEGVFVGSRMQCDCLAAQFGRSCKHQLAAREWLAAQTPSAKYRQSSQPGDTAMMRRDNRPFSLLAK